MRVRINKRAQSIIEYSLMLTAFIAAMICVHVYMKRSITGKYKETSDQIGEQFTASPAGRYTIHTHQSSNSLEESEDGAVTVSTISPQTTTRDVTDFNSGELDRLNVFSEGAN